MTEPNERAGIKIPAPILTIIHVTLAILLGWRAPLSLSAPLFVRLAGFGLAMLGFILGVLALIEFRRHRATTDPKKPAKSFVTSGIYRYTRNPIYLGFVFILIGLPMNMGNYWGIVLAWPLITLTNNLVIKHEETQMEKKFKDQYADYRSRVRRWL
ncbi:MAG: isoprenylcysteine carboxylmethyltransferase family protein [Chloroflexi bacterium]|nr:isoprenylcysteine carboxylmethyltransferase family protein [Chloroflexota bacterium]